MRIRFSGEMGLGARLRTVLGMVLGMVLGAGSVAQAAELPVRQVVLYKHGVGYFQRSGQLAPGETAQLDFKPEQMNDVLKSLTIQESGNGSVVGLRYDSSEPLEVKLAEFPFQLGERQPLSAILDQLKGAQVELRFGSETVQGKLVGARLLARTEQRPETEQITLLLDSGEFRNYDLSAAASVRFLDPALQAQFVQYLGALQASRSRDRRSVYIDSNGAQARQVAASYMIPMPVWKSSYRLLFGAGGEPLLEGWAIVDNTTGEDWSGVQLSLVSGRPISFISQLYEPRYRDRPVAELPEDRAQAPVVYGGAVEQQAAMADEARRLSPGFGGMAAASPPPAPSPSRREAFMPEATMAAPSAVQPGTAAQELGELFEYRFSAPVTVRQNESAMLPFLQEKVNARKLLVYSNLASVHPLHSVEISNSTGKTLDGGPITVYEDNAYAGEALVEALKKDDKRLISYGVDLGTRIATLLESQSNIVREVHFRRGLLTTKTAAVETRTYTINNVDARPKTLIIQHPIRREYKVLNQTPAETTAESYRFEVQLAAGATESFPVTEERVIDQTFAIANLTPAVLITFIQNRSLPDNARSQLQQILDKKRQIAETENEIERTQLEINNLFQDQERLRQNINSLNRVTGQEQQVQAYARQLATQEAQLAALRDRLAERQRHKVALEEEMNALIERMEF